MENMAQTMAQTANLRRKLPELLFRCFIIRKYRNTHRKSDAQVSELFQTRREHNACADREAQQLFTIRQSYSHL
jgi:hypothetical protein